MVAWQGNLIPRVAIIQGQSNVALSLPKGLKSHPKHLLRAPENMM